jgi:hypothetical protein
MVVAVESDGKTIQFDRKVSGVVNDLLYIRAYQSASGEEGVVVESYTIAAINGNLVTVTESLDPIPEKDDIAAVGTSASGDEHAIPQRRIIKLTDDGDGFYEVTVEQYAEALYSSDDSLPSVPVSDYEWPSPIKSEPLSELPITWTNIQNVIAKRVPPAPATDIPRATNINWSSESGGAISWVADDEDDDMTVRYKDVSYAISYDSGGNVTSDSFVFWDSNYPYSFFTTDDPDELLTYLAAGSWLICQNVSGVPYPATPIQVLHAAIIIAKTIRTTHLIAECITTPKVADGAITGTVTAYVEAESSSITTETSFVDATFVASGDADVEVTVFFSARTSGASSLVTYRIYRDTTEILEMPITGGYFVNQNEMQVLSVTDNPSAGEYDYSVTAEDSLAGVILFNRLLKVQEFKK